ARVGDRLQGGPVCRIKGDCAAYYRSGEAARGGRSDCPAGAPNATRKRPLVETDLCATAVAIIDVIERVHPAFHGGQVCEEETVGTSTGHRKTGKICDGLS